MKACFQRWKSLGSAWVAFSPMANGFLTGKYGKGADV